MTSQAPYIVAFCGLPSSGKSTLINSLIGKRILQSGVCRTTTNVSLLENEIIVDDDNNKFIAIDLPGICDSEENDKKFNEMTEAHITNANLIFFVSDVNKAFITTHEVNEYKKIKKIVKDLEKENGQIYDVAIILSKCDFNISHKEKKTKNNFKFPSNEISDSDEDTDFSDLVNKVKEKLPQEDIILFNAFGRIAYNKNTSNHLKKLVEKSGVNPSKNNISFSIKKYCYEIQKKQELSYMGKFNERMKLFVENKISFEKTIETYNNLNEENQYHILENLCDGEINFKHLKIADYILSIKNDFYNKNKNKFASFYIKYYIHIINNNYFSVSQNFTREYNLTQLFDLIQLVFSDLSYKSMDIIFDNVIFETLQFQFDYDNNIFKEFKITNIQNSITFLNKCYIQNGGFEKFYFYNKFNNFIKSCDKQKFQRFYNLMIVFCKPKYDYKELLQYDVNPEGFPTQINTQETYLHKCEANILNRRRKIRKNNNNNYNNNQYTKCNSIKGHENEAIYDKYHQLKISWTSSSNQPEKCNSCNNYVSITKINENYTTFTRDNEKIMKVINNCLKKIRELINDPKYILYNKLEILNHMFKKTYKSHSYHFKNIINIKKDKNEDKYTDESIYEDVNEDKDEDEDVNEDVDEDADVDVDEDEYESINKIKINNNMLDKKILNHPEYIKLKEEFYKKFLGNMFIPYVKEEDIVFVSLDEILYVKEI